MINPISLILIFRLSSNGYEGAFSQSKSQYFVSSTSFAAILTLWIKSARLSAFCASCRFAPILVPERNSCLAITYCFLDSNNSQKAIMFTAKSIDFIIITFSLSTNCYIRKLLDCLIIFSLQYVVLYVSHTSLPGISFVQIYPGCE